IVPGVRYGDFERGFLIEIEILNVDQFLPGAAELFARAPVRRARLRGWVNLFPLTNSPHLARLATLDLSHSQMTLSLGHPAPCRHVEQLTTLILRSIDLDNEAAQALAESERLPRLTHLDLGYNRISDAGARALAESPHRAGLLHLNLHGNPI